MCERGVAAKFAVCQDAAPEVSVIVVLLISVASADIPPPDAASCEVGQACTLEGQAGTCVQKTRTRATPTGPVESSYTACQVGAAPEAAKPTTEPAKPADEPKSTKTDGTARCQASPGAVPFGAGLLLLALFRRRR